MKEEWRTVAIAPAYEVSNFGRVKRVKPGPGTRVGRILKQCDDGRGYPVVSLWINGKRTPGIVHRLVAFAFIGPPPTPQHEVAHWDGNPKNTHVANLRWATRAENHADKLRHGTDNRGERHGFSRLTAREVTEIVRMAEDGVKKKEIARRFKCGRATIWNILKGNSWGWLTGRGTDNATLKRELEEMLDG